MAKKKVTIPDLQRLAYRSAIARGKYDKPHTNGEMIGMMHAELSEAFEELQAGCSATEIYTVDNDPTPHGVPVELADCVILILSFCESRCIDLEKVILQKMAFNATREHQEAKE